LNDASVAVETSTTAVIRVIECAAVLHLKKSRHLFHGRASIAEIDY